VKLSIKYKLVLLFTGGVALMIAVMIACNSLLLKPYYTNQKEKSLTESFHKITELQFDSPDINRQLLMLEETRNIQILIVDCTRTVFFCSDDIYDTIFLPVDENGELDGGKQWFSQWLMPDGAKVGSVEIFTTQPQFGRRYNKLTEASYLSLYARADKEYLGEKYPFYIIINSSVAAIEDGVTVFNHFTMFVGVVLMVLGFIAAMVMGSRFVKPIEQVNITAKKMTQLDFSERLVINTGDEISEMAESVNKLSDQLAAKIDELSIANLRLEAELVQRERVDEMRKSFISDVSHELKTPLSIILGYCEGLQLNINGSSEEREYYCSIIEDEAMRMSRLAQRLLQLAELESGNVEPVMTEFDLAELAQERLQKLSLLLEERGIAAHFYSEGDTTVYADAERMEEVINNLLTNANNHTPDGGVVKVTLSRQDGKVLCEVYNSGSHIPEESIDKIWESFYKVDKARTRSYGGSGLGLKIVSTILRAHNADFGVENMDNGVRFYFSI